MEFVSNLYRENGHTVIQCNIRDITERKHVEAELVPPPPNTGIRTPCWRSVPGWRGKSTTRLRRGFTGITTQLEAAEAALATPASANSGRRAVPLAVYQAQLEKVQSRIGKARDLARESLDEARRSVAALRSPPLEAAPLSEALARFLTQQVLGTAAKSRYVLEGIPYALPAGIEHCLLRIGQEAIANAVKHALAQEIDVELSFEAEQVRLRVRDDGRGFDPSISGMGRFGIIGMRERAEKVQGDAHASSAILERERKWT